MWKKLLIGGLGTYTSYKFYMSRVKLPAEAIVTFEDYCISKGYFLQTHWVTTEDGYILRMYRMSKDPKFPLTNTPVLLVHGLTHSAITFVIAQNVTAPAFRLADNDYDVWLLNTRGNFLSRLHTSLKASQKEYWKWCSNQIGIYDLPASIDYILENTQHKKINYLGHSQGGFVALHCFAYKPEYGDKVNIAALLAPPGGIITAEARYMKVLLSTRFLNYIEGKGINLIGEHTAAPNESALFSAAFPILSSYRYRDRYDITHSKEDPKVLSIYFQQFTGGTSLMNLKYLRQIILKKSPVPFAYDYGPEENQKVYGSPSPPSLNYHNIRCKLAVFYGKYDQICIPADGEILLSQLPKEKLVYSDLHCEVDHSGFAVSPNQAHMDKILELFKSNEIPLS